MENTLPITKEVATQVTLVTSTGVEKAFCLIGIGTVALLAFVGILTIIILIVKAIRNGRK